MRRFVLLGMLMFGVQAACDTPVAPYAPLTFRIDEGRNINSFFQQGPVAANLLLRSGDEPRILVAFPAGNSGVGLWFEKTTQPVTWKLLEPPRPLNILGSRRRPLRGIEFEVAVDARELHPRAAVLSSIRVLRDYELTRKAPAEVLVDATSWHGRVAWARHRFDGAAGYQLVITALDGAQISPQRWVARPGRTLRLRIRALTGEPALTPLRPVLNRDAGDDARARNVLGFLSYREKFLAGSWRFDTYYGRDTLMSALLLAPVLEPEAVESAISSVLDRLARDGEVAHEEDIGEFAVLRNVREGRGRIDIPFYDYGMVDDDFMLAPLAARWLLDDARGRARARFFLAARDRRGERRGAALVRNIAWVVERCAAFADHPVAANLVGIKAGRTTGNWRDSEQGLGGGRYPYDVNAALVPAALEAAARLFESGLLHDYLDKPQLQAFARARGRAQVWTQHAPGLFAVDVDAAKARAAVTNYARQIDIDAQPALQALGERPLQFHALSLDERGRPIPILNSDEGFRLLFTDPPPEDLERSVASIMRPFPAGLLTGAGLLVANPALVDADLRREFTRFAYHGTVVWSWQQALLAAGLEHQLRRPLPGQTLAMLARARSELWSVIEKNRSMRSSELWSWSWSGGQYHAEPFGRAGADVDESNAAQLWSTVYLGLQAPD
jgi:hypothetical protein